MKFPKLSENWVENPVTSATLRLRERASPYRTAFAIVK